MVMKRGDERIWTGDVMMRNGTDEYELKCDCPRLNRWRCCTTEHLDPGTSALVDCSKLGKSFVGPTLAEVKLTT